MNLSNQMKIITKEAVMCSACNKMLPPDKAIQCEECKHHYCGKCWEHHYEWNGLAKRHRSPERPEGIEEWEWNLGKTDPAQKICGYCGAPYYPGDPIWCASCAPHERGGF